MSSTMTLKFQAHDIKNRGRALTYDDVLLVPEKSEVLSRKDPDLSTQLTKQKPLSCLLLALIWIL